MSNELRKKYSRQKRLISGLYLTAALLMLSMVFNVNHYWLVTVFVLTAIIAAVIMVYLQRCPGCKKRLPHDFNGTCKNCGAELDDEQELR